MKRKLSKTAKTKRKTRFNLVKQLKKIKITPSRLLTLLGVFLLLTSFSRFIFFNLGLKRQFYTWFNLGNKTATIEPVLPEKFYFPPTRIRIEKVNLDLAIKTGGIEQDDWVLYKDAASFLPTSGLPGEGFNTIIYAHNWVGLFASLKNLKIGDVIEVVDMNDQVFTYRVREMKQVKPKEVEAIKSFEDNTLTLFTCDGAMDQYRLIVKAGLVKNVNILENF